MHEADAEDASLGVETDTSDCAKLISFADRAMSSSRSSRNRPPRNPFCAAKFLNGREIVENNYHREMRGIPHQSSCRARSSHCDRCSYCGLGMCWPKMVPRSFLPRVRDAR
jgi:hypothetical protein